MVMRERGQLLFLGVRTRCTQTAGGEFSSGSALTIVKVEAVEVHPLHQVAEALGLKRGQARVADLPVGRRTRASWQKPPLQSSGCRPKYFFFFCLIVFRFLNRLTIRPRAVR